MLNRLKKLKKNIEFIKYFKNTSWLLSEKIIRMSIGLCLTVWLARHLGPESYGLLSYVVSFTALFSIISTFGLDNIITRELVKSPNNRDKLLGTSFVLKIIGSILMIFLLIAFSSIINNTYTSILILLVGFSYFFLSFNVIDYYFQSKVISRFSVFANCISLLFSSILKIMLILNNSSLVLFCVAIALDSLILASGYIFFYKHNNLSIKKWFFDRNLAFILLKDGWPLMLSGFVISIYMKIDQVMINHLLGSEAVGQYSVAATLSEAWYFIPAVISSSLFPAIVNAKMKSQTLYIDRLQKLYRLMVILSLSIAIPITFLSGYIVNFIYGPQYNQAANVLTVHIWAGVFMFIGFVYGNYLITENKTKIALSRNIVGAFSNVILNIFLIPKYGIIGAAYATIISVILANYLIDLFSKNERHQFIMKSKALIFIK